MKPLDAGCRQARGTPHSPESFEGRLLLDVGTGSGRHAFHAAELGARVVAVDIGRSIDVARGNLPPEVLTVQADAEWDCGDGHGSAVPGWPLTRAITGCRPGRPPLR
ncbi:MAG: class I SAM-dependent methyltransferase [Solirubrobacteraceae bacterium]